VRVKAVIAYDGTGYSGFQIQKNAPTIQEELEHALVRLTGCETRVLASGRTDAGVHAEGQVIAFDTEWKHSIADLQRGMNAVLPEQIAVRALEQADSAFHPRFDAVRRYYRYTVYWAAVRNPLAARYSLHVTRALDLRAMQEAARHMIGRHDFWALGSPPQGNNAVRDVFRAAWSFEDPWLFFDIEANAFLYRMVRMTVGTLLRVGYGALTPDAFGVVVRQRDRAGAGPAVAAHGLCLKAVTYG
jgi:tRNA pseudouridine38-40 synthase